MFPMEFDHRVLESLPLPGKEDINRVLLVLHAIVNRRIFPYFKKRKGTDPTLIVRQAERFQIKRLEDDDNQVRTVSLISRKGAHWTIHIHERIFDYLAFVLPTDPESKIGGRTSEESKVLAFAEFFMRHEMEHILYPEKSEREAIHSDVLFAMDQRANDPTFYRMLRNSLADEMTGLKGEIYLALFDSAEQEKPYEYLITRILDAHVINLEELPEPLLRDIFPTLDRNMKTRILGECYQRSSNNSHSLYQRISCFQKVLRLFGFMIEDNENEAKELFNSFIDRWGYMHLFRELGPPSVSLEDKSFGDIFSMFKDSLAAFSKKKDSFFVPPTHSPKPPVKTPVPEKPSKSLNDRIIEAKNDPLFPRQALEVIEKNRTSAVGHSGPKYTELIETLLSIPWGKIQKITIDPVAFEEGLNKSHYGLERPKEIICDFFANLIWRYKHFKEEDQANWHRTGGAFLFVGPPGVGKTSLAISIAENLGIPYHKISLGGMQDEADLRGHGFTYEGSKPGAIVQGLIKMGVMNGMFIMDEADKTEKFAISTLLEILDPEQNHLFHDKYTMTTVDIDLSNCFFILTANTLETVPPPVINRCEVIHLDRYSLEEKVAIAQQYLIKRVRDRYQISEEQISFDPGKESELLAYLIKTYTHEPGVRELERLIRTLFLRILRKELLAGKAQKVLVTRDKIKQYLDEPIPPRQISEENRVGEILGLGVNLELGIGSVIPIQATRISAGQQSESKTDSYLSMVHATGNIQKIMDESRKVATTAILYCAESLGIDINQANVPTHLHFMGASTPKDGPSAGGAIALALASALSNRPIRRDVAMTGEIDTQGRILPVGGLDLKLEIACNAGCKTMIIPKENMHGDRGIEQLPMALKKELHILTYEEWKGKHEPFDYTKNILQVVGVNHIVQAADIAFVDEEELKGLYNSFIPNARSVAQALFSRPKEIIPHFCLIYVKDVSELDANDPLALISSECMPVFISDPQVGNDIIKKFPESQDGVRFINFDPKVENLSLVIQQLKDPHIKEKLRISICAPFYFLMRDGIQPEHILADPRIQDLRLFANNFTLQGIKIKSCKPILNKIYSCLAVLDPEHINSCPFLGQREGIYVIDLSFIPEKYRLDVKHAEEILQRALLKWLDTVRESQTSP